MASLDQWEKFMKSGVWMEWQSALVDMSKTIMKGLRKADTIEEMKKLQGELSEVEILVNMPQLFINDKKVSANRKENE